MKKIYINYFMSLLAAAALLVSCGNDDGDTSEVNNNNNGSLPTGTYISANVEGTQFETLSIAGTNAASAMLTSIGSENFITITANSASTNVMIITLRNVTGPGTFNLNEEEDNSNNASFADTGAGIGYSSTASCEGASGTLKVTHYDEEKIEGTFEFVGKNDDNCSQSKNVTEGNFRGVF